MYLTLTSKIWEFIVRILEKIYDIITASHCTNLTGDPLQPLLAVIDLDDTMGINKGSVVSK